MESEKSGLVYEISGRGGDAICIGKTRRSLLTKKRRHYDTVKRMVTKKSGLYQHIVDFDYFITWNEAKISKMEANYYGAERRVFHK